MIKTTKKKKTDRENHLQRKKMRKKWKFHVQSFDKSPRTRYLYQENEKLDHLKKPTGRGKEELTSMEALGDGGGVPEDLVTEMTLHARGQNLPPHLHHLRRPQRRHACVFHRSRSQCQLTSSPPGSPVHARSYFRGFIKESKSSLERRIT